MAGLGCHLWVHLVRGRYGDQTHVVGSQGHQAPCPTSLPAPWAARLEKQDSPTADGSACIQRGMRFPWCHPASLPGPLPNAPYVLGGIRDGWTSAACPGSGLVGNMGWAGACQPGGQGSSVQRTRQCPALLLASPGLRQAARLSAAGDRHAGWQGGVEESSLILKEVWYPPAYLQTSHGGHQDPTPSLWVTSNILIYTGIPLLPSYPVLHPYLRCSPRASGEVAGGLHCPGGLRQSRGEHRGPELPAGPQPGPGGCWWLWQWEGAHLSGTGALSDLLLGSQAWEIGLQAPR